jgi:outer membrane lipoprotein SlyB
MKIKTGINRMAAILLAAFFSSALTGAPPASSWGVPKKVQYGTIMAALPYSTDGYHSGGGMVVGTILGSAIARNSNRYDYTVAALGCVAGAAVGMMVEKSMNSESFVQVHVLLDDDGKEIEVTQYSGRRKFRLHDEVKVLYFNNGKELVYHRDEPVEWETNPYIDSEGSGGGWD